MNDQIRISSVSLVRQGEHKFYSFTMPTEALAEICFVINRDEDPNEGFQRELDIKRAKEIANYIDSGLGTIPSSIILSAQEEVEFIYDSKSKSVSFKNIPKGFLIIDGQHRVYGFKLAKTAFRVPVIVYDNLSKRDETRLFIDINSKQKGVPMELLLDIKKMADYENDSEEYLREIFDIFLKESDSVLYNRLSPSKKQRGHLTRSVFNTSLKPLVKVFGNKPPHEIYEIFNAYLYAVDEGILAPNKLTEQLYNPNLFKAISGFFPLITSRVKDKFGAIYSADNYYEFTKIIGQRIKPNKLLVSGNAYKPIIEHLEESLKQEFTL